MVTEREVREVRTKDHAERIAAAMQAGEAFVGQRFVARPSSLRRGSWAVVLIDGDVAAQPVTFRGGRGERPEDAFAIGQGKRTYKDMRGTGHGKGRVYA